MSKGTSATSIPVISLEHSDDEVSKQMRNACIEHGFFYVKDHGVSSFTLQSVMEQSEALFALSLEEKKSLSDPVLSRGYTGMQEETLDPGNQTEGDTKEGFYIGRDIPESHALYNPAKLRGPNRWPKAESLPKFRSAMEDYSNKLSALALRLVRLLALSLHLPKDFFDKSFEDPIATIRLLHYDCSLRSNPGKGIFGCGAHSDYGMITILLTDENPGLQLFTKNKEWINVPPIADAFVVNLGDMLERWTNGMYKSTLHRVLTLVNVEATTGGSNFLPDRYSIPFFYDPGFDTSVECIQTCWDEKDNPKKYLPITSGQHLLDKYSSTHADFKPSDC